ncbi:MAG: hypothetical protein HWE20_04515 [Gammaproteobacteria bacterium]|nr:hypothetical protein [Gammaproteobacteria bacterium]
MIQNTSSPSAHHTHAMAQETTDASAEPSDSIDIASKFRQSLNDFDNVSNDLFHLTDSAHDGLIDAITAPAKQLHEADIPLLSTGGRAFDTLIEGAGTMTDIVKDHFAMNGLELQHTVSTLARGAVDIGERLAKNPEDFDKVLFENNRVANSKHDHGQHGGEDHSAHGEMGHDTTSSSHNTPEVSTVSEAISLNVSDSSTSAQQGEHHQSSETTEHAQHQQADSGDRHMSDASHSAQTSSAEATDTQATQSHRREQSLNILSGSATINSEPSQSESTSDNGWETDRLDSVSEVFEEIATYETNMMKAHLAHDLLLARTPVDVAHKLVTETAEDLHLSEIVNPPMDAAHASVSAGVEDGIHRMAIEPMTSAATKASEAMFGEMGTSGEMHHQYNDNLSTAKATRFDKFAEAQLGDSLDELFGTDGEGASDRYQFSQHEQDNAGFFDRIFDRLSASM